MAPVTFVTEGVKVTPAVLQSMVSTIYAVYFTILPFRLACHGQWWHLELLIRLLFSLICVGFGIKRDIHEIGLWCLMHFVLPLYTSRSAICLHDMFVLL